MEGAAEAGTKRKTRGRGREGAEEAETKRETRRKSRDGRQRQGRREGRGDGAGKGRPRQCHNRAVKSQGKSFSVSGVCSSISSFTLSRASCPTIFHSTGLGISMRDGEESIDGHATLVHTALHSQ
ncbi:hypothetical protein E2C01_047875 [Portunus trituberculatus]|uniref:Uncharacterized protein n=1 Tax=Portunus trituberculatus TaxID=210409 RepID=A0A5B7G1Q1_PORTR|nr:hypothetical protein [Portunus trituberculatus]